MTKVLMRIAMLAALSWASMASLAWAADPAPSTAIDDATNHPSAPLTIPEGDFITLAFHDIRDDVQPAGADEDPYANSTQHLAQLLDWIDRHDWHPVSLAQIEAAHAGGPALPTNAVLLSFDDGLSSIYTKVFPLLKAYQYPAMFALETGWLREVHSTPDHPATGTTDDAGDEGLARTPVTIAYNNEERGADGFVSWPQVREMQDSGLATFVGHSDNLHQGALANPQGNKEPAALARLYDAKNDRYESDAAYRQRIRRDIKRNMDIIARHTGVRPNTMVWPYGAMSSEILDIGQSVGIEHNFSLADRYVPSVDQLRNIGRVLIMNDAKPAEVIQQIDDVLNPPDNPQRIVQVDLDYVYDPDPAQENANLGKLLDRIKAMHITAVYLQAFADPDGDGTASALYFPNRFLPMREDLFNRAAWQLRTRAGVDVYAWLPMLAFDLPNQKLADALRVKIPTDGGSAVSPHAYRRLSPFYRASQAIVSGIYVDLVQNTPSVTGILLHDDAYLSDDEDASACDPNARWPKSDIPITHCQLSARDKTDALIDFGEAATQAAEHYANLSRPFEVVRNLYARVVLEPDAEARFAQALPPFLAHYDHVALMAMPYMEDAQQPSDQWLQALARQVASYPQGLNKTIFELQAQNWKTQQWIDGTQLSEWMKALMRVGAVNLGYYPDDFLNNKPALDALQEGMSLNQFPHIEGH